jgi:hypothetical protein
MPSLNDKTGVLGQDRQNWTTRTGQPRQDSQGRTAKAGHPWQDSPGQDNQDKTARIKQL